MGNIVRMFPNVFYILLNKSRHRMTKRICDENCNGCPIIGHPNSRMVSLVLNMLHDRFGKGVHEIVQSQCPNLTVCFDCRIDDFCHIRGCKIIEAADKVLEDRMVGALKKVQSKKVKK